MPNPAAILLIGIPATGKSTFYRHRFARGFVHISLDILKSRYQEKLLLEACFVSGRSFVVDNTNVTRRARARFVGPAREAGYLVVGYYFTSRLLLALERNRLRQGTARVPDQAVRGLAGKLELPSLDEGFDQLWYVHWDGLGGFRVETWFE